jgi:hypothetical protein
MVYLEMGKLPRVFWMMVLESVISDVALDWASEHPVMFSTKKE